MLPGMAITSYDVSPDGSEIVFAAIEADKETKIWHTRADRREPPRQIASMQAFGPVFGAGRSVYFRGVEGGASYIFRTDLATGATEKFRPEPVVNSHRTISPDRKWVVVTTPFEGRAGPDRRRRIRCRAAIRSSCASRCFVSWSRDASTIYFTVAAEMGSSKSLAVPLRRGQMFPQLPPGGFTTLGGAGIAWGSGDRATVVYPGTTAGVYAYVVQTAHRNLYRSVRRSFGGGCRMPRGFCTVVY